jgi:hypothetical protein
MMGARVLATFKDGGNEVVELRIGVLSVVNMRGALEDLISLLNK